MKTFDNGKTFCVCQLKKKGKRYIRRWYNMTDSVGIFFCMLVGLNSFWICEFGL